MADFSVQPLTAVAEELRQALKPDDVDHAVLLAERPGLVPYALEIQLPPAGHELWERGMALLWARAVTVAAAIVGSADLKLVTVHPETFERLQADFAANPKVTAHLEQYGPFKLSRASKDDVPGDLRAMPFATNAGEGQSSPSAEEKGRKWFLGVDYGRSDVKCAVVDECGKEVATYVTRWWKKEEGAAERTYLDPASLVSIEEPLQCLGEAALDVVKRALEKSEADKVWTLAGLGLSAAGCVRDGRLCGLPPAFGGCDATASAAVLERLEHTVLEYVTSRIAARFGATIVCPGPCSTLLVNDGDASALWGAQGLESWTSQQPAIGLFLSCGTGLAGGIVKQGGAVCGGGVLEVGKLVMGLPFEGGGGVVPRHDTLQVPGSAQGMAGTQRSFFNLLAARGGERIDGKAEQRAAIVAMQKRPLDDEVRTIFSTLGGWLAQFVLELSVYLPFSLTHVEAGGKLTDGASGEVMLTKAKEVLQPHGVESVRRADESEFGQALALALGVLRLSSK